MNREEACRTIFDYLRIWNERERANAIFVLGGSTLGPPDRAAALFREGLAPRIAFTDVGGTFRPKDGVTIDVYRKRLLELGVPRTSIRYAPLSTNTLEEARAAVPFMQEGTIEPLMKVILVSRPVHQRRAWATFKRWWPKIEFINCPADELFDPQETDRLVRELARLEQYGAAGDLIPQEFPPEVQEARTLLFHSL